MRQSLSVIIFCCTISIIAADSPRPPVPLVFTSEWGSNTFFAMIPADYDKDYKIAKEAHGIAYKLDDGGKMKELYRTDGWYSFQVYISRDGQYLARMGPWSVGHEPEEKDLAVAFYKGGKLLKEYSTKDLIKDPSKLLISVSHYMWLAHENLTAEEKGPEPSMNDYFEKFELHTIDGWTYVFDITNGEIKEEKRTKG